MKSLMILLLTLVGASASATSMEVSFQCSPKGYDCAPGGVDCRWSQMFEGVMTTIPMRKDNRDIHRARYQTNLDGHQLTVDFLYDEKNQDEPLRVNAYLAVSNVMAESSGVDKIDVALRNNTFGRGFVCSNITVE